VSRVLPNVHSHNACGLRVERSERSKTLSEYYNRIRKRMSVVVAVVMRSFVFLRQPLWCGAESPEQQKKIDIRKARLQRMIGLKAPDIILLMETEMLLDAYTGGGWHTVWWIVRKKAWWRWQMSLSPRAVFIHWYFKWSDWTGRTVLREDGRHSPKCEVLMWDVTHDSNCMERTIPPRIAKWIGFEVYECDPELEKDMRRSASARLPQD